MGMIIEHVLKGSKKGKQPPSSAEQKERQKRVAEIKKDMLEKIHYINQNFHPELKEELGRSQRGEHVFNNGILRFHSNVLIKFIQNQHIDNLQGYNQQALNVLGRHTLPPSTETKIQREMVVNFADNEFYINANAIIYGEYCRALSGALLDVLKCINPGDVTKEKAQWVNFVIERMNTHEIYVDQLAKVRWINNQDNREEEFEQVRQAVVNMYNTDRGLDWCFRILHVVAPWFEL